MVLVSESSVVGIGWLKHIASRLWIEVGRALLARPSVVAVPMGQGASPADPAAAARADADRGMGAFFAAWLFHDGGQDSGFQN
jgi:hypothetical protein